MENKTLIENFEIMSNWFVPTCPDIIFNGILKYNKDISLTLFGALESLNENMSRPIPVTSILYGHLDKPTTLFHVQNTRLSFRGNFMTSIYHINEMLIGAHVTKSEKFREIIFSYPFFWKTLESEFDNEGTVYGIPLKQNTNIIKINLNSSTKLQIIEAQGGNISQEKIERYFFPLFKIICDNGILLDKLQKLLLAINYFITLCMDRIVYPTSVHVVTESKNSCEYYPYWRTKSREYEQSSQMGFPVINYDNIKDSFENIIQEWLKFYFKHKEIIIDYFNIYESTTTINTKFTENCHVLQRLYDVDNSSDDKFSKKIKWFLSLCPKIISKKIEQDNFIDKVVDTRDYNVHGMGRIRKNLVKTSSGINHLLKVLQILTIVFMLKKIGIKDDYFLKIFLRNRSIFIE